MNPLKSEDAAFRVLLLTAAVAAPPFLKLGSRDAAGNRYYRAYFTADFVWHTALTAEVAKFSMPPRNPFHRNRALHDDWAYVLLPAAVIASRKGFSTSPSRKGRITRIGSPP